MYQKKKRSKPSRICPKMQKLLKKGESLAVEGLLFMPGRHVPLESSHRVIAQLVETLKEHADLKIEIQGHICCYDGDTDGYDHDTRDHKLSENRAKIVYNYLIKYGIDEDRLTHKGYGHKYPKIFPEQTPYDEQMNRRVEIKIVE